MLELNAKVNDEMLKKICGGNYGDSDRDDYDDNPRYHLGQQVEVYTSCFHVSTITCTILAIKRIAEIYNYKVKVRVMGSLTDLIDGSGTAMSMKTQEIWITADDIES